MGIEKYENHRITKYIMQGFMKLRHFKSILLLSCSFLVGTEINKAKATEAEKQKIDSLIEKVNSSFKGILDNTQSTDLRNIIKLSKESRNFINGLYDYDLRRIRPIKIKIKPMLYLLNANYRVEFDSLVDGDITPRNSYF